MELLLCAWILRGRVYRHLPFFSAYLASVLFSEGAVLLAYSSFGYVSREAWYAAWTTQALLLLTRGLAIAEVCCISLRAYRGVWTLTRWLLSGTGLALVACAAAAALGKRQWIAPFVLTLERGLELAAVVILITLLGVCRYYEIHLPRAERMIALGLGVYSAAQVINNSFMREWLTTYFHQWNAVRSVSYLGALVIWLLALRKPLPAVAPAPPLLPQHVYDDLAPQVNYRLRLLNQRLVEILKS